MAKKKPVVPIRIELHLDVRYREFGGPVTLRGTFIQPSVFAAGQESRHEEQITLDAHPKPWTTPEHLRAAVAKKYPNAAVEWQKQPTE